MSKDKDSGVDFKAGISSEQLAEGELVGGHCGKAKVVVMRKDGEVCALSAECTHLGADLATGVLTGTSLRCPWHHARFDIHSGEAVGAPAFEPLDRYEVSEANGKITVGSKLPKAQPKAGTLNRKVVIVGAGAGGHACAEWLVRRGVGSQVTLIGDEDGPPYDRTFCSKQFLAGKKSAKDAALAPLPGIRYLHGNTVIAIDTASRSIELDDGNRLEYDELVLATGAEPVRPKFRGDDDPRVFVLRTLDDATALIEAAKHAKHVGIIGASFIGLEAAASLRQRDLAVTVIAPDDIPLAKKMGEEVGNFVQRLHEKHGVTFELGREVSAFDGQTLLLDDGRELKVDLVVAGTGVSPRLELAKKARLELADKKAGGGVKVDEHLLTSDPHIHAIGDIASFTDARLDSPMRVEHWVVAQRQGQFVARHLLGESERYVDTPFFWSGHYGKSLRYVGHGKPDDRRVDGDVGKGDFLVDYLDDEVVAAQLVCGRDQASLATEAEWDAEALGTDTEFGAQS